MENENIELIRNNPKKAVLKLSFPIFIMLIISMVYNLIDTVWVSGLGPNALSAMAFVSPIYMLFVRQAFCGCQEFFRTLFILLALADDRHDHGR